MVENDIVKIVAAAILPNLGNLVNGPITRDNLKPWYAELRKPSFNPPDYVFAPVWTAIYVGMGYASYLVYRDAGGLWNDRSRTAMLLYGSQLALNWAWTPIFFKYHSPKWSLVELIALTATAAACAHAFYKVNPTAGLIFIPYLGWLTYAGALNYAIHKLNPVNEKANITDVTEPKTLSKSD